MKTIASLCSSAAAMTSSSFTEPPGWMMAVAPALAISSTPSGKGKNAFSGAALPADLPAAIYAIEFCKALDYNLAAMETTGINQALARTVLVSSSFLSTARLW